MNHNFQGLYFTSAPTKAHVFDDFGDAVALDDDQFMQVVDFILTAVATGH